MSSVTTKDGTEIYYGFRCIGHDRRGHGRSGQSWRGNDLDTYAGPVMQVNQSFSTMSSPGPLRRV
jgi:alpha-beta hydrolase superfamily lysophospholipase